MQNYIGKVLRFDEAPFNENIKRYEPVLSAVRKFFDVYETLDPSFKATNEVWKGVLSGSLPLIAEKYRGLVHAQLKAAKLTARAIITATEQNTESVLSELKSALQNVLKVANDQTAGVGRTYIVDPANVLIQEGKIILNPAAVELIKKSYEYKVETKEQNEFYNHLLLVQSTYDAFRDFLNEHSILLFSDTLIGISSRELFQENEITGGLDINDKALGFLK